MQRGKTESRKILYVNPVLPPKDHVSMGDFLMFSSQLPFQVSNGDYKCLPCWRMDYNAVNALLSPMPDP